MLMIEIQSVSYAHGPHAPEETRITVDTNTDRSTDLWDTEGNEDDGAHVPVLLSIIAVTALLTLVYTTGPHAATIRIVSAVVLGASLFAGCAYYLRHQHQR